MNIYKSLQPTQIKYKTILFQEQQNTNKQKECSTSKIKGTHKQNNKQTKIHEIQNKRRIGGMGEDVCLKNADIYFKNVIVYLKNIDIYLKNVAILGIVG